MELFRHRGWLGWAPVALLALLCAALAVLQYRWIGEISDAERTRLHEALQTRLAALRRTLDQEISEALAGLMPTTAQIEALGQKGAYAAQYVRWQESHDRLLRRVGLAAPDQEAVRLSMLDFHAQRFLPAEWPDAWNTLRQGMTDRITGNPGTPMPMAGPMVFELPRFGPPSDGRPAGEQEWLIVELDPDVLRASVFPELLNRFLSENGRLDYDARIVAATEPGFVLYDSRTDHADEMKPDGSISLMQVRPFGFGGRGRRGPPPARPPDLAGHGRPEPAPQEGFSGRWLLSVRHRAGSLETLVARTRRGDMAISGAILALILATGGMLLRASRRAQQLAQSQMNFVANVSHELRTPLAVIRTAAFNLRGGRAKRPEQVERYGALIQEESEKLGDLVERVLRFSSAEAGRVIRDRAPVEVESLIQEGVRSGTVRLQDPRLVVETKADPDLPPVLADRMALVHVLQNLVENAVKYGAEGGNWIGVFARRVEDGGGQAVEIRIADRGPGIPPEEQKHIFDPFFRGRRALDDQIHGTGLGLSLVKKIVEAHGGTIRVKSEPMRGAEFIVRLPASPEELQDEFAHSAH